MQYAHNCFVANAEVARKIKDLCSNLSMRFSNCYKISFENVDVYHGTKILHLFFIKKYKDDIDYLKLWPNHRHGGTIVVRPPFQIKHIIGMVN